MYAGISSPDRFRPSSSLTTEPKVACVTVGFGTKAVCMYVADPSVVGFTIAHQTDNLKVVHDHCCFRHALRNLQLTFGVDGPKLATIFGAGFQVPDIDRQRSSAQPHRNARLTVLSGRGRVSLHVVNELQCRRQCNSTKNMLHETPPRQTT